MTTQQEPQDPNFVQSLARGLAVIRAFDADHSTLSLSEVARRSLISPAAARRFLLTLEALGYVRVRGRNFTLTPRVLELGMSYLSALSLPSVIQPHLEILSQSLNESVSAAVLAEDDIVYVARVSTRRIMSVGITIGTRFPAHATSMGRVLLASLSDAERAAYLRRADPVLLTDQTMTNRAALEQEIVKVQQQGWALVDGELEQGLCSVAAPVRGSDGEVSAAINISTTTNRHSVEWVREHFVPHILHTANEVEQDLRHL